MRERLRVALERCSVLEEQLAVSHKEVSEQHKREKTLPLLDCACGDVGGVWQHYQCNPFTIYLDHVILDKMTEVVLSTYAKISVKVSLRVFGFDSRTFPSVPKSTPPPLWEQSSVTVKYIWTFRLFFCWNASSESWTIKVERVHGSQASMSTNDIHVFKWVCNSRMNGIKIDKRPNGCWGSVLDFFCVSCYIILRPVVIFCPWSHMHASDWPIAILLLSAVLAPEALSLLQT